VVEAEEGRSLTLGVHEGSISEHVKDVPHFGELSFVGVDFTVMSSAPCTRLDGGPRLPTLGSLGTGEPGTTLTVVNPLGLP